MDWSGPDGLMIICVWFLLAFVPSVIINHIYDIDSESLQGRLIYISVLALIAVLWFLAVGLYHVFSWVTNWVIDVSNHLHSTLTFPSPRLGWGSSRESVDFSGHESTFLSRQFGFRSSRESVTSFGQKWTVSFRRFGWRSLRGYANQETSLLSGAECPHTCQTTSKLCQECFHIVENSRLLSGTFFIFTPRTEWHKWHIPVQGSEFTASRRSCQLCHILWNSLHERTRHRLTNTIPRRDLAEASWLWVSIWKDAHDRYYISLFDEPWYASRPETRRNLCKAIEITEEYLKGQSPSVHITTWTGDCVEIAKSWIAGCQAEHSLHCSKDIRGGDGSYLPTRLLYVGDHTLNQLRLQETSSPDFDVSEVEYLALSYCRSMNALLSSQKLTLDKNDEWKYQINENELPLTFQHAIHLTRRLKLNYLWVDALCIIQDSPEDQRLESSNMSKVFANAYCTIATSSDANGGCLSNRTSSLLEFPCYLRFSKTTALTIRFQRDTYSPESFAKEADHKNLSWPNCGFQERILSRRIVHFNSRFLFFECNTHIASEAMPGGQPFRQKQWFWERRKRKDFELQSNAFHTVFNPVTGYRSFFHELRANRSATLSTHEELNLHKAWFELVSRVTLHNRTSTLDRKVAILGLARAIQGGEQYLEYKHGLWHRHLLFDLLWFVESGRKNKPTESPTRSWSWQSVKGVIGISQESLMVGKERAWMKAAELVTREAENPTACDESEEKDHLILKCPLYRCTNIFPSRNQQFILQLQTPEGRVEATFVPDFLDLEHENLVAAEIVRDVTFDSKRTEKRKGRGRRGIEAIGSHGIVLQRNYVDNGDGVKVTYERVGRFWMQWPLLRADGDPRAASMASCILGRMGGVVVRIE